MKFIDKRSEPESLRAWRLANKTTPQNLRYRNIPGAAMSDVRASLLGEQGGLCAYTMWRIPSVEAGHVEHIHPQSHPPADAQIAYANMIYCHPGDRASECPFGAQKKADALVSQDNFVSPLDSTCQDRFTFTTNGAVKVGRRADAAAQRTIDTLCLNHDILKLAREAAVQELPIFKSRAVSASEAKKQAKRALERDGDGRFRAFAVAIHQAWARYAEQRAAKELALSKRPR